MSLSSETQRVQQGVKDTLKTLIQKLGGTVSSERVDGYPALANVISNKLLPDNLLSAATAASLGLSGTAVPNEAFAKLKSRVGTAQATANGKCEIHTFSYVGTGTTGTNNKNSITADKPIIVAAILFRSGSDFEIALLEDEDRFFMLGNVLTTSHREGYGFGRVYGSGTSGTYPAGSKSADGKTFYWSWPNDTTSDRSLYQYNESGVTYYGFYIC